MIHKSQSAASLQSFPSHRTDSSTSLHHIREVVIKKRSNELMGCEFARVGRSIFVTLVRKYEATAFTVGAPYTYGNRTFASAVPELTPAFRAGLDFGDEILRVNGADVHSMTSVDIYTLVTEATLVHIDYRAHSNQTTFNLTSITDLDMAGITLSEGQVTAVKPGSQAYNIGFPVATGIISINGKSTVGLTDQQINDMVKHDASQHRKLSKTDTKTVRRRPINVTVVPYKLYAMLLIGMRDAMSKFAITSTPAAVIDNLNNDSLSPALPNTYGAVDPLTPKLTNESFTSRDTYRPRATSRSAYFIVGAD